ncbi:MAG: UDP-N-acetylmuramoyl-tripeptide--D-alanyl-D-alanine ligase [Actinomycetota bacterium]|nr:UDP-N-acetylmuramoyl-tripeptide--D-alanyl-D-alanine ligase [Actinomycetota bacterium]
MNVVPVVVTAGAAAAAVPGGLRWLRVAQREHYLPGSTSRFAKRWWLSTGWANLGMGLGSVGAAAAASWFPWTALVSEGLVAAGPLGLKVRGRAKPLAWTPRMRSLAGVWAGSEAVVLGTSAVMAWRGIPGWATVAAVAPVACPVLVDAALAATAPFQRRSASRWIDKARQRLESVGPVVVGVTGSYGKTTTKGYIAHLCSRRWSVLASPASFNNALGLARTVNENLAAGTEVLVAEMGAFGPGEIARLCSWMHPRVGVITALGPVHLERFGSEEAIARAKAELVHAADVAVINVNYPRLAALADDLERSGKRVWRCSGRCTPPTGVVVRQEDDGVVVEMTPPPGAPGGLEPARARLESVPGATGNVACALAAALEMGVPWEDAVAGLGSLPVASHRLEPQLAPSGAVVLDDTYNSNPAGARLALQTLAQVGSGGRRVVVTPGMVELGRLQHQENASFAKEAAAAATDLVVVGRTNRSALVEGAREVESGRNGAGAARLKLVRSRDEAVAWVRETLGDGDAVLYENDLPDHFP